MAAEGSNSIDALGQFQLHPALGAIGARLVARGIGIRRGDVDRHVLHGEDVVARLGR